ncbi:hypothetical protein OAL97_04365 [Paracoccaceae bacterium]|jgi:hypothetical protein|nr:hypothetical protein [Paracoccaceae bacterium]
MSIQYQSRNVAMMDSPEGKETIGASTEPFNKLEAQILKDMDPDNLNDLAESLFVLNNRHYGPIPGAYVAVCVEQGQKWCVGQLNADRRKPVVLFEDKVFASPEEAQHAAEQLKASRGEFTPCRCN